ncbi:MAG: hypothetical protein GVY18_07660 [Bacteroidetes bacterium]|jgi:hypothetical protein|nr:hypothetical protein [Bacteroidota bacterium]
MTRFDPEKAAAILADAIVMGDEQAAKRNGCTTRTIRNYRAKLGSDPQLSESFRLKKQELQAAHDAERMEWAAARSVVLRDGLSKLRELIAMANDVDHIHPVAGAIKIVGELDIAHTALMEPSGDEQPVAHLQGPAAATPAGPAAGDPEALH